MKFGLLGLCISAALINSACATHTAGAPAPQIENDEAAVKFDATKAWDEFETTFRLFYAFIDRDDFDVEALIRETKRRALKTQNAEDFRMALRPLGFAFTDPHLIIGPLTGDDYNVIMTSSDLSARYEGGRYYIADVRMGSPADEAGFRVGDEILSVSGVDIQEAAQKPFNGYLPQLTQKQRVYGANLALAGLRGTSRLITINADGAQRDVFLPDARDYALTVQKMPLYEVSFVDGIAIIKVNNILGNNDMIKAFDKAAQDVQGADGIIIDFRNTPSGGNTEVARAIMGHFVTEPRAYQTHEIPSLEREFSVPRRFTEYVMPRAPQLSSEKLVVLGGKWTGSMGEGLVIGFDAAAYAYTICSDMGDLLGSLSNYDLEESGIRIDMGSDSLFHVNGTPRGDYICDVNLQSADNDKDGNDPAMAAALDYLTP